MMLYIPAIVILFQNSKQPIPKLIFPSTSTFTEESKYSDVHKYYSELYKKYALDQEEYDFVIMFGKYWLNDNYRSVKRIRVYRKFICQGCDQVKYYGDYDNNKKIVPTYCKKSCGGVRVFNNQKYTIKHDYFNTLDESKAYELGYLFSMGSILNDGVNQLKLIGDYDKLTNILGYLGSDVPIKKYRDNMFSDNPDESYTAIIINTILLNDLYAYGLNYGDMFSQSIPDIPIDLYGAFIRGFLDGCDTLPYSDEKSSNKPEYIINKCYMIFSRDMFRWIRDYLIDLDNIGFVCDYFGIGEYENISVIEEYYDRRFYMRILIY